MRQLLVVLLLCIVAGGVSRARRGCVSHPETAVLRANEEKVGLCLKLPGRACFDVRGLRREESYEAVVSHSLASTPARITLSVHVGGGEDVEDAARPLRLRQLEGAVEMDGVAVATGQRLSLRSSPSSSPPPPPPPSPPPHPPPGGRKLDTDKLFFTPDPEHEGLLLCLDAERHVPARDREARERPLIYSIRVEQLNIGGTPQIVTRLILFAILLASAAFGLRSVYRAARGPSAAQLWYWLVR